MKRNLSINLTDKQIEFLKRGAMAHFGSHKNKLGPFVQFLIEQARVKSILTNGGRGLRNE